MKSYLALLFGAAFCFGAIAPATAEAHGYTASVVRDDHHRDKDQGRRFDRSHDDHHRHHRHHAESHRVLRKAHFAWHHGHRVWVPARWVVVYY